VELADFGIRGIDLGYALTGGYDAVILVDAAAREGRPGDIHVIEPTAPATDGQPGDALLAAHDLDPASVLRLAAGMGECCQRVLLVACEPEDLGGLAGSMELSATVAAAVGPAAARIEQLIHSMLQQEVAQ
jgi:hydrogenase maturation protease